MGQMASHCRPVSNNLPSGSMAPPRYSLDLPTREAAIDHAMRNEFEPLVTHFTKYDSCRNTPVYVSQLCTSVISSTRSIVTYIYLVRNGFPSPCPTVQIVRDMDTGSLREVIPGNSGDSFDSFDTKRLREIQNSQRPINLVDGTLFVVQRDGQFSTGSYIVHRALSCRIDCKFICWASVKRQSDGKKFIQKLSEDDAYDEGLYGDVDRIFPLLLATALL